MTSIAIVDYGSGNLRSVQKAFERLGAAATITSDPDVVGAAERLKGFVHDHRISPPRRAADAVA
jgi:hypothetical protein